jgi:thymidylate synthase
MSDGFPLLTTKKIYFKGIVTELLWFLKGDTNIKYLIDNDCHIWDGDCFANYIRNFSKYVDSLPENGEAEFIINKDKFINKIKTDDDFAKKWGELGPIYGRMWRKFDEDSYGGIDQIANLINDLKTNPDSRRLLITAWHPGYNQHSVLPPCHYGFQVYTRELNRGERVDLYIKKYGDIGMDYEKYKDIFPSDVSGWNRLLDTYNIPTRAISLMWNQRSVDTFLGLPFNIASYGLLLELIAKAVNMVPDESIGNLGDCHLYLSDHIEAAKEQISREPYELPTLDIHPGVLDYDMENYEIDMFTIKNYKHHPKINATLSN